MKIEFNKKGEVIYILLYADDAENNLIWKLPAGVFDLAIKKFGIELFILK